MLGSRIWGLDLGRAAVKGVLVTPSGKNGVKILDADIVPLEGPPPEQGGSLVRDPRLWQALRIFNERHGLHGKGVALSVPAHNVLVRDLEVPSVGQKKMQELVRFEASSEIPFVLDEVMWDYTLFPQTEQDATRRGFLLAVKKNVVERYLQGLDELGIERIETITVAPLSLLHFAQMEFADSGRTLALDIGAAGTSMLIVDPTRFWMRTINTGGHGVTDVMQREFDLDYEAAEKAKKNMARSQYAARIMKAVRPAMDDMVRTVRTNMNYLEKSEGLGDIDTAYALGGGSRLTGLTKLASRTLDMPLKPLREVQHVTISGYADVDFIRSNMDRLATAVGVGLAGLRRDPEDVSFLPAGVQRAARISKSRGAVLLAGLLIWVILLTGWGASVLVDRQVSTAAEDYRRVESQVSGTASELSSARELVGLFEEEMNYLLRVGAGAGQFVHVQDQVVMAFKRATVALESSIDGPRPFQMLTFECARVQPEGRGADHGLISGIVQGYVGAEEGMQYAYDAWQEHIINGLRYSLNPAIATEGTVTMATGQDEVVGKEVRWVGLVQPGDYFLPMPDGPAEQNRWYQIVEVKGNRLTLAEPYQGPETEAPYIIARVEGVLRPSGFPVDFALLQEPPPTVEDIKEP